MLFVAPVLVAFVVMVFISSLLLLDIFYGSFFWVFLGTLMASTVWLMVHISNTVLIRPESRKIFRFISFCMIGVLIILLIKQRFIHAELELAPTGISKPVTVLENFIE